METQTVEEKVGVVLASASLERCQALSEKEEETIRAYLTPLLVDMVNELDSLGVVDCPPIPANE